MLSLRLVTYVFSILTLLSLAIFAKAKIECGNGPRLPFLTKDFYPFKTDKCYRLPLCPKWNTIGKTGDDKKFYEFQVCRPLKLTDHKRAFVSGQVVKNDFYAISGECGGFGAGKFTADKLRYANCNAHKDQDTYTCSPGCLQTSYNTGYSVRWVSHGF